MSDPRRACAREGCGTLISAYRPGADYCSAHARTTGRPFNDLFPDWTADAACRGMDPDYFDANLPSNWRMTSPVLAAKRVCADCPVWERCLEWAFETEVYSTMIVGGLAWREREAIRSDPDRLAVAATVRLHQRIAYRLGPLGGEAAS